MDESEPRGIKNIGFCIAFTPFIWLWEFGREGTAAYTVQLGPFYLGFGWTEKARVEDG